MVKFKIPLGTKKPQLEQIRQTKCILTCACYNCQKELDKLGLKGTKEYDIALAYCNKRLSKSELL